MLNVRNTNITVVNESSTFWSSSSPFLVLEMSSTKVAGHLPLNLGFNQSLLALHVDNTSMQGTIPFSWLGPYGLLSRIVFGGQALWRESEKDTDWRRVVCLNSSIYNADANGTAKLIFDKVLGSLNQSVVASQKVKWVDMQNAGVVRVSSTLAWVGNTPSIKDMCLNHDAPIIIACLWGSFLALIVVIMTAYFVTVHRGENSSNMDCVPGWLQSLFGRPDWLSRLECLQPACFFGKPGFWSVWICSVLRYYCH